RLPSTSPAPRAKGNRSLRVAGAKRASNGCKRLSRASCGTSRRSSVTTSGTADGSASCVALNRSTSPPLPYAFFGVSTTCISGKAAWKLATAAVSTSPPPGPGASGNSSLIHTTRFNGPGVLGGGAAVGVNTGSGGGAGASTVATFSVVVPGDALPSQALNASTTPILLSATTRRTIRLSIIPRENGRGDS